MPRNLTRTLIVAMLLGLVGTIVYVLFSAAGGPDERVPFQRFATGSLEGLDFAYAGEVPGPTPFLDPEGKMISLADLKGKVILVNLWATWCGPCEREMPTLGALQTARGGDTFDVVAISVDQNSDGDFAKGQLGEWSGNILKFFHAPDYAVTYEIGARGFPTSILYDANGQEVARYAGELDWSSYEAVALIDAVIAED